MKHAAIYLAPGFEECEALMTVDLLKRAGIDVTMVSVHNIHEVTGSHNITVKTDKNISDVKDVLYDAIIMPGGMPGTAHLLESEDITDIIKKHHEKDKILAAICAAPSVYGVLGLLNDKQAICFPGFEENLHGAHITEQKVVRDGNMITAKALGSAFEFAHTLIEALYNKEKADQVIHSVYY